MNFGNNDFALERLVITLEVYRYLKSHSLNPIHFKTVDAYLMETLSIEEWIFWCSLTTQEQAVLRAIGMAHD